MAKLVEFFSSIVGLPKVIVDAIISLATDMHITVGGRDVWFITLAVCLFISFLPFFVDRFRSVLSKSVCAYGAFCFLCYLFLGFESRIFKQEGTFAVNASISIMTVSQTGVKDAFAPSRFGSNSCDADDAHTAEYCSNTVKDIQKPVYNITSANCGSGIDQIKVEDGKKNCVTVLSHVRGCGYDRLPFGINNCRGRGWLEYQVTAYGEIPNSVVSDTQDFKSILSKDNPAIFDLQKNLASNQKLLFHVVVTNHEGKAVVLTNEVASKDEFSAAILPDGSVQVSVGKKDL